MKQASNILSVLALLLFLANYPLAQILYGNNSQYDENIAFRFNEYAIIILFTILATKNAQSVFSGFILSIFLGVSASDVIDRLWFDITEFRWNDILMLIMTIYFSYKNSYGRTHSV